MRIRPITITDSQDINIVTQKQRDTYKQALANKAVTQATAAEITEQQPTLSNNIGSMQGTLEEMICEKRFSMSCAELMRWKTSARELCTKKCHRYGILAYRPSAITSTEWERGFPFNEGLSATDKNCLMHSGFYCAELSDENRCKQHYFMSCAQLSNWVERAQQLCLHNRYTDCSNGAIHRHMRPPSSAERDYPGMRLANGAYRRIDSMLEVTPSQYQSTTEFEHVLDERLKQLPGH